MKKSCLCLALLLLTGCTRIQPDSTRSADAADEKEPEKDVIMTCTKGDASTQFRATGDEITSTIETFVQSIDDSDEDLDKEALLDKINESLKEKFDGLEGVEVQAQLEDDQIRYTYTINYLTADTDRLLEEGILQEGEMENQYVSLEKTKNEFENSDYVCTIQ